MKTLFLIPIAITFGMTSLYAMAQTAVSYTSAIANYQPFVDEKVTSWKTANDNVGQIGGWKAYAKEAQQADNTPTPSRSSAPLQKPSGSNADLIKANPHAGHQQ